MPKEELPEEVLNFFRKEGRKGGLKGGSGALGEGEGEGEEEAAVKIVGAPRRKRADVCRWQAGTRSARFSEEAALGSGWADRPAAFAAYKRTKAGSDGSANPHPMGRRLARSRRDGGPPPGHQDGIAARRSGVLEVARHLRMRTSPRCDRHLTESPWCCS